MLLKRETTKIKNITFTGEHLKFEFEDGNELKWEFKLTSNNNETINEHVERLEINTKILKSLFEQFKGENIFNYIGKSVELYFHNGKLGNFKFLENI